jgi:hypothetical protein
VLGQHLPNLQPLEEDTPPESDLLIIQWSRRRDVDSVRGQGLDEVVVVAMDVHAVAELLQILAEST